LFCFSDSASKVAAHLIRNTRQHKMWLRRAGIGLAPQFSSLTRVQKVTRDKKVVVGLDYKPFLVASALAQLPGTFGVFHRRGQLIQVGIHAAQSRVSHRKFTVKLDGSMKVRERCSRARQGKLPPSKAVGFERLRRRSCGFAQGSSM